MSRISHNPPPVPPMVVLSTGILVVSSASIMIRYAQQEAPSMVIAAYRLTAAALILTPVVFIRYREELGKLRRRDLLLGLVSGLFLALHFATWITSLAQTSVTSSIVLVQSTPLWVALLAPVLLGERPGPNVVWGLALALIGGTAVTLGEGCSLDRLTLSCQSTQGLTGGNPAAGNFLALCGAWAAAGYLLIGRNLRARLSLVAYIYLVYGFAAVLLIGATLAMGLPVAGYSQPTYIWMIQLAVGPQLIGHSSFNWALAYLPAYFVSITFLGESIGAILLAFLLLNETPSVVKLTGAGLILFGIYLASQTGNQAQKIGPVIEPP